MGDLPSEQIGPDGKPMTEAAKAVDYLRKTDTKVGDFKHKHMAACSKSYELTTHESKADIPMSNCDYKIASGFDKGAKNGIREMHHFMYHPQFPKGMSAAYQLCLPLCDGRPKQLEHIDSS